MADRQAASLFCEIFGLIVEYVPKDQQRKEALRYWKLSRDYDFSEYQMYCDENLIALGLAKKGVDPEYPDDGETILYADGAGSLPEGDPHG